MRFDGDRTSARIGYERRVIRYRVVRLLDAPDELRSVEIGQLDQGDEVQLLEKSGAVLARPRARTVARAGSTR